MPNDIAKISWEIYYFLRVCYISARRSDIELDRVSVMNPIPLCQRRERLSASFNLTASCTPRGLTSMSAFKHGMTTSVSTPTTEDNADNARGVRSVLLRHILPRRRGTKRVHSLSLTRSREGSLAAVLLYVEVCDLGLLVDALSSNFSSIHY